MATVLALWVPPATAQTYGATIWNGTNVPAGRHTSLALIELPEGICTGTLIHRRWVLTAAHCLHDVPAARVALGLDGVNASNGFGELYMSSLHVVHPRYNDNNARFDFALVKLPRASTLTPVTLVGGADEHLWQPGVEANIVGWGAVDGADRGGGTRLREGFTVLASDADCAAVHDNYDAASMMCVDAENADACRGDSGGPLFALDGEDAVQVGVTSFGENCDESLVGVYGWLPAALPWINRVIAGGGVARTRTEAAVVSSARRIQHGQRVAFRARLFRAHDGASMVGQRVEILRRPAGTRSSWTVVGRRTTNINGMIRFRHAPGRNMAYAVRHRRTVATTGTRSPAVTVRVIR